LYSKAGTELLHTASFYTEKLLHTHRGFYTEKLLHRRVLTQRSFYAEALTQRSLYTEEFVHTEAFNTEKSIHNGALTH
jgi:hypothetical protein